MSQQSTNQESRSSSIWALGIYNSFQNWFSKEIIDFDPFDDEAIVTQQVLEQFRQAQAVVS
jgi:hypothetical protein